jgi:hypothetical protein
MGPRSDTPASCSAAGKTCRRGAACARSGGPPSSPPSSTATVRRSIGAIGERRRHRWGCGTAAGSFDACGVALTMRPRSDTPASCSAAGKTCRRGAACARSGGPPVLAPIVTGDAYRYSPLRLRRGTRTTRAIGALPTGRRQRWGRGTGARIARRRVPRQQSFPAPSTMWAGPRRGPTEPAAAVRCANERSGRETFRRLGRRPSRWGPARTPPLRAQRPERRVDGEPLAREAGGPQSSPPSSQATRIVTHPFDCAAEHEPHARSA